MTNRSPFNYFKTSTEIIRPAVMLYVRFPLSLRNVEDLLYERDIDVSHEARMMARLAAEHGDKKSVTITVEMRVADIIVMHKHWREGDNRGPLRF